MKKFFLVMFLAAVILPVMVNADECDPLGCEVDIPAGHFLPGDEFYCDILICNPTETTIPAVPLFSLLDIHGDYFVFPLLLVNAEPGINRVNLIPSFIWPGNVGEGSAAVYAAMTDPTISEVFGQLGFSAFTWSD